MTFAFVDCDSAGDTTAINTEISSIFPPLNDLPSSLARLANGTSSSSPHSNIVSGALEESFTPPNNDDGEEGGGDEGDTFLLGRCWCLLLPCLSETLLAREQSASESIPARVRRPRIRSPAVEDADEDGEEGPMKLFRKRTTSSRISSSQRLSLNPSDARTRISSSCTGRVNTFAS